MKKLKIILPFIVILFLSSVLWSGIAHLAGERIPDYNHQLEGAKILDFRRNIIRNFPSIQCNILLAGSSRTMSDFSPHVMQQFFTTTFSKEVTIYTAGNVASRMTEFKELLSKGNKSNCIVLEFSPHTFNKAETVKNDFPIFQRWRLNTKIFELRVSGYLRQFLHIENLVTAPQIVIPRMLEAAKTTGFSFRLVYMALFGTQGYFEQQQEDGQVFYRIFLRNRESSEFYQHIYGKGIEQHLDQPLHPDANEWLAFTDIVTICKEGHKQLILVRPPLSPSLYAEENSMQADVISRVKTYARSNDIPYIDMNPNPYSLADGSHIDWFDTKAASLDLAHMLKTLLLT